MRPALTQILQPQSESDDSMNDSDITRRNLINTIQTEAQVHNPRSVLHRGNPTTLEKQVSRTEEEMDGLMKDDDNEFENTSSNAPSPLLRRHPSKFVKLSKATSVNTEEIEVLQDSDDSTKGDESMNEGAKLQGNNVSPSSQKNNNDNSNSASEIQKSSHKKNKKQVIVNLESDDSSDDCTIPVKKQKVRKAESKEKSVKHKITKRDRKFMKDSACFNDYLDERKVHGVEKGTRLKKCGYYISQHIGSLRSQLYPEMSQNNKKHTQEPDSEEED
ncbi:metabotropic glutamate receptor-like protein P isoform X4 [Leptopilina heterotoma]|uniref:metabotropic glutamate receptor-like protein P isoform X4 n=1 Tax=Leptopilina heterotoma TaxID=63436 RepID=UPI001CA9AC8F|nr:metabotropic glutamate receptor-like protein P isoform X4 [Leptopilina heterotoma]